MAYVIHDKERDEPVATVVYVWEHEESAAAFHEATPDQQAARFELREAAEPLPRAEALHALTWEGTPWPA